MFCLSPGLGDQEASPASDRLYKAKPPETTQRERVAIIVNHGMGQQVPYQTIESVAQAVWKHAANSGAPPVIRNVRLGITGKEDSDAELIRAEMDVRADGRDFDVHIYEAYWAPLTEGKVTLRDVIGFFFSSGWDGITNSIGVCARWMFGSMQELELNHFLLGVSFVFALTLILSLVIMNSVVVAIAASHAIGASVSFPSIQARPLLIADLLMADLAMILIGLATWFLPWLYRVVTSRRITPRWMAWLGWALISIGAIFLLMAGLLMALHVSEAHPEKWIVVRWFWGWFAPLANHLNGLAQSPGQRGAMGRLAISCFWGIEIGAAVIIRWMLVEYPGDVVAYVAAHSVSKFWELRQQIWQLAMKVARVVYRAQTADRKSPLYDKIIMVGHSLGSVIAYDVLNGLLIEDGFLANPVDAANRTRMFLTFGSPLDKTAFLFRTQADIKSPVREVAAAAVQPMIQDYKFRPKEWVNLWSHADIISGELNFYDDTANMTNGGPRRVCNKKDPEARTPLAAHMEYWNGNLFAGELFRGITT
jgi:hypothetical protein